MQLAVTGEIDMVTVGDLSAVFPAAPAGDDVTGVVVDFAEVTFRDSSGIRALDEAYAMATCRGIWFRLVNPRRSARRVFGIVGARATLTRPAPAPDRKS